MSFVDVIIYVENFPTLVAYLDEHYPTLLKRDEDGNVAQPPVVVGIPRTPARETSPEVMVYVRLTADQDAQWRGMDGVTVLAEAPFTGRGTGDAVYQQVFSDPDKYAIYSRVYPHEPYEVDDGEGGTITVTPPKKFGIIAGA